MSLRDDITAALARADLTDEQKGALVRRIKAQALLDSDTYPASFSVGLNTVTIHSARLRGDDLELVVSVARTLSGNVLLAQNDPRNPFVFINPPTLVEDIIGTILLGGRSYVEAPRRALRAALGDTLRQLLQ